MFLLGMDSREDGPAPGEVVKRCWIGRVEFRTGGDLLVLVGQAKAFRDGMCRHGVISGDHDDPNTRVAALVDGVGNSGTELVFEPNESNNFEGCFVGLPINTGCDAACRDGNHPHPLVRQATVRRFQNVPHLGGWNDSVEDAFDCPFGYDLELIAVAPDVRQVLVAGIEGVITNQATGMKRIDIEVVLAGSCDDRLIQWIEGVGFAR